MFKRFLLKYRFLTFFFVLLIHLFKRANLNIVLYFHIHLIVQSAFCLINFLKILEKFLKT